MKNVKSLKRSLFFKSLKENKTRLIQVVSFFFVVVFCLGFLLMVRTHRVDGHSMMPTLKNGDRLLVKKNKEPERYELITFVSKENDKELYVKRVIGVPGDQIWLDGNSLYIVPSWSIRKDKAQPDFNSYLKGNELPDDTLKLLVSPEVAKTLFGLRKIPSGQYWVLGDNRTNSQDSRHFGLVTEKQLEGVVFFRYYPLTRFGEIN